MHAKNSPKLHYDYEKNHEAMTSSLRTWPESLIVRVLLMVVSDYTVTTD